MDIQLRRCIGSVHFGISAHDAPVSDFPTQPSQKDGLGRMCKPHWTQYTGALRKAALARKAENAILVDRIFAAAPDPKPAPGQLDDGELAAVATKPARKPRAAKPAAPPKRAATPRKPRVVKTVRAADVVAAQALLDAAAALSGKAYADAIASDDVQAALEVIGKSEREALFPEVAGEKRLGETIDDGAEEAVPSELVAPDRQVGSHRISG